MTRRQQAPEGWRTVDDACLPWAEHVWQRCASVLEPADPNDHSHAHDGHCGLVKGHDGEHAHDHHGHVTRWKTEVTNY